MGVLQSGVVLAAQVAGTATLPSAERAAYHAALVALAGEDRGPALAAWRAPRTTQQPAADPAAPPRKPEPTGRR